MKNKSVEVQNKRTKKINITLLVVMMVALFTIIGSKISIDKRNKEYTDAAEKARAYTISILDERSENYDGMTPIGDR